MDEIDVSKLNPDIVAARFIEVIVNRAYYGVIRDNVELLQKGAKWPKPTRDLVRLHEWYIGLDKKEQNRVKQLISEVAEEAIFHVLAILDGVAGSLITGTLTELSVRMVTYTDEESEDKREPKQIVDVNPREVTTGLLHDLFQEAIHMPKVNK